MEKEELMPKALLLSEQRTRKTVMVNTRGRMIHTELPNGGAASGELSATASASGRTASHDAACVPY